MPATNDYRVLGLKYSAGGATFETDADYALLQTTPSETQVVQAPPNASGCAGSTCESVATKVELVCQFRDDAGDVLTEDRGAFDVQLVRVVPIRGQASGSVIVDTVELKGQQANRPFVIGDVQPGDEIAIRFVSIAPVDGAYQLITYMREVSA